MSVAGRTYVEQHKNPLTEGNATGWGQVGEKARRKVHVSWRNSRADICLVFRYRVKRAVWNARNNAVNCGARDVYDAAALFRR